MLKCVPGWRAMHDWGWCEKKEVGGERCGTHIRPSLPTPILTRYTSKRLNSGHQ